VTGRQLPPVLEAWVRQLLSEDLVRLVTDAGEGQIEIRLVANRGKVRRQPTVLLNAGSADLVAVDEVA
jgi:hypothetical protein